jgi:hypothetical protein
VSNEDYEQQVERITADLFTKSESFRQTVVYREMTILVRRWAAFIGITNVLALVGVYYGVYVFMEQTVAEKATKAVTERNEAVNKSIETLTATAISQAATMKSELEKTQKTVDEGKNTVAQTLTQAAKVGQEMAALRKTQEGLSTALKSILDSGFLKDDRNIQRVREIVTLLAKSDNAKILADLQTQVLQLTDKTEGKPNRVLFEYIDNLFYDVGKLKFYVNMLNERAGISGVRAPEYHLEPPKT